MLCTAPSPGAPFSIELDAGGTVDALEDLQTDLRASHVALSEALPRTTTTRPGGARYPPPPRRICRDTHAAVARAQRRHGAGSLLARAAAADGLRLVLVAAATTSPTSGAASACRPSPRARRRRIERGVALHGVDGWGYALDDEAGGVDACERVRRRLADGLGEAAAPPSATAAGGALAERIDLRTA